MVTALIRSAAVVALASAAPLLAATTPAFTLTTAPVFPATAAGSTSAVQNLVLTTTRAVTITSVAIAQTVNGHQEFTLGTMTGCSTTGGTASGTACTIPITFTPYYTGLRKQTLSVTDSTGLIYNVGLQGLSTGAQTLITPGSNATYVGTGNHSFGGDGGSPIATGAYIYYPEGVYFDASNNMYIADLGTHNIRVVYQSGASLACLIEIEEPALFGLPAGSTSCAGATSAPVAGNLYTIAGDLTPATSSSAVTHQVGKDNGVLATESTASSSTLSSPSGVGVDAYGNVYISMYGSTGFYVNRMIYVGGQQAACLIEIENPTLFGLAAGATSCTGATSSPQFGFIYNISGTGTAGASGDGGLANADLQANVYAMAVDKDGDFFFVDDSTQAARTSRIRVVYNGGAQAAALIASENPGTTPQVGYVYKLLGGTQASTGDGALAANAGMIYGRGITVDADGDVIFTDYNTSTTVTTVSPVAKVRVIWNGGATMANLIKLENPSVTPVQGYVYTLAGSAGVGTPGTSGYGGGTGDGGLASAAMMVTPYGVTTDPAGDIFFTDSTDKTVRKISAADGIINIFSGVRGSLYTTSGNAFTVPAYYSAFSIALGSSGTLAVGDTGDYRVRNDSIVAAPYAFPTAIPPGGTSAPTLFYFTNQGNAAATIASVTATTNFKVTPVLSTMNPAYATDCSKITSLPAGQTCTIAVVFAPTAGGNLTGTMTVTDNADGQAGATHSVTLTGVAALQTQVALTSSANPTYGGNNVTYTAVVSVAAGQDATGAPALIGTVTFTDGANTLGAILVDTTGTATVQELAIAGGTHAIKALYMPDPTVSTSYSSSTASLSEVVNAINTSTVLTSSTANADVNAPITFTATVSVVPGQTIPSGAPATLAGSVAFTDTTTGTLIGTYPINAAGVATATTSTLTVATHTITAVFTPTSTYFGTSTGTLTQIVSAPSWTVATTSLGVAVATGNSVAVPFTFTAVGGYKGTITQTCSILPTNVTCSFSPNTVSLTGDGTYTSTLTIGTAGLNAMLDRRSEIEVAGLLGAMFILLLPRKRRRGMVVLAALMLLAASAGVVGCGKGAATASRGTFNVTANFTDGTTTTSIPVTVSVLGNP
jgi:hypothetical protein